MSDFDDNQFGDGEGIKKLRKAYKDAATENKELKERLERLEAKDRSINLTEALVSRGLDRRVARLYPANRETTAQAVDEWVEENRDLFGSREVSSDPANSLPNLTPTEIEGYEIVRKIQAAEAATEMDFRSKLAAAETPEQVIEMMKQFGAQHTF